MLVMPEFLKYNFRRVEENADFIDLQLTYFKENWILGLQDEYIIFNVFDFKDELMAIVAFEYIRDPFQLNLQLLEVIPKHRGQKIAQVILAFGLELHRKIVPDDIKHASLIIESKSSARDYYRKLGAVELESDRFFFPQTEAEQLIQRVKNL